MPVAKKKGTDLPDYTVVSDDSLYTDKDTSQSDISQYSEHSGPAQYRVSKNIVLCATVIVGFHKEYRYTFRVQFVKIVLPPF